MPPTISGYTTTYNCIERLYPVEECIQSLLGFCDEVVVVDGGSDDGTIALLREAARKNPRINFSVDPVDFSHRRWAIYMDGYLKAKARRLCVGDYCWQTDTDEIVPPSDWEKVRRFIDRFEPYFEQYPVVHLPMVEFWGAFSRIRADFVTIKPRLSRNSICLTHGIPLEYRSVDAEGHEYPTPFESDSCNYIWEDTKRSAALAFPLPMPKERLAGPEYERWFGEALDELPSALHVSWLDLERKIRHYRAFWPKFHASMYNLSEEDSGARNVMFSKPWSEVTDEDIRSLAISLAELGPRSFHHKLDRSKRGATIPYDRPIPPELLRWAERASRSEATPTDRISGESGDADRF